MRFLVRRGSKSNSQGGIDLESGMAAPAPTTLDDAELREAQRDYLDFLDDEVSRSRRACAYPGNSLAAKR